MKLELAIRFVGAGERCSHCGRIRDTTRFTVRSGEELLQQFLLCDPCADDGYVVQFDAKVKGEKWEAYQRRRRIKVSRKMERGLAEDLGGKVQPGSGNQDAKADVRVMGEWRLEHKYTNSVKGYSLRLDDLAAVIKHANMAGEWPGLVICFRRMQRMFTVLPYELFQEIVEKLRE